MEAVYTQYEISMLVAEFFISYAIESMKYLTQCLFAYELSLRFVDSIDYNTFIYVLTAFLVLAGGWITDSYVGKFYFVIAGTVSVLLAYFSYLIGFSVYQEKLNGFSNIISPTFIFIYIIFSNARNLLILDQVHIMKRIGRMHSYIFVLVYLKTLGRAVFLILILPASKNINIHLGTSFAIVLLYLILLLAVGHKIHFEAVYLQICELSILRYKKAMRYKNRRLTDREVSSVIYKPSTTDTIPSILVKGQSGSVRRSKQVGFSKDVVDVVRPKPTKSRSLLKKQQPVRQPRFNEERFSDEPYGHKLSASYEAKFVSNIARTGMARFVPIAPFVERTLRYEHFWGYHYVTVHRLKSRRVRPHSSHVPSISLSIDRPNLYGQSSAQKPKPQTRWFPSLEDPDSDSGELLVHLHRARNEIITQQALSLSKVLPILILGVGITLAVYTVITWTNSQALIAKRCTPDEFPQNVDILLFSIIFDLILFPLVEFILFPVLRKYIRTDLHFALLGYFIMLIAITVMFSLQFYLIRTLDFLPLPLHSRIMFFNDLGSETTIHSNWLRGIRLSPYGMHLEKYVRVAGQKVTEYIYIFNEQHSMQLKQSLDLIDQQTVTYIITSNGLHKNAGFHPSIFTNEKLKCDKNSNIYIISKYPLNNISLFFFNRNKREEIKMKNITKASIFSVDPGEYEIFCESYTPERSIGIIQLEAGALYIIFIYLINNVFQGKIFLAEKPVHLFYEDLLVQVFLLSVGFTISNTSFFRFLYVESPSKMRTLVFNILLASNLLLIGIVSSTVLMNILRKYLEALCILIGIDLLLFGTSIYFSTGYQYRFEGH